MKVPTIFLETAIQDLCKWVSAGSTPLRSRADFYDGGTIDWYKTGELKDWYLGAANERITERALKETSVKLFPANTVLMAMYGDGKTITSMGILRAPATTNQACSAMLVDEEKCDQRFFFYALKGRRDLLLKVASGGAQRNLSGKLIKEFALPVPPLPVQQRIAGILSAYDELIENNQRRIKILEAMARGLYREWFVHFRFPGHENHPRIPSPLGEIPQGWELGRLDDVLVLQRGFDLPKSARIEGTIPIIAATGMTGFHDKAKIKAPGVVTGRSGTIGKVMYVHEDFWPLNTALWVKAFPNAEPLYAYYVLSSLDLKQFNSGAAVPTLNRNDIHGLKTVVPCRDLQRRFQVVAGAMVAQSRNLELQTQNLRRTRDLLLPRLLAGQIDVEAA